MLQHKKQGCNKNYLVVKISGSNTNMKETYNEFQEQDLERFLKSKKHSFFFYLINADSFKETPSNSTSPNMPFNNNFCPILILLY